MKLKITALILIILCLFISGCGGGGTGITSAVPQTISPAAETASLEFQVPWPEDGEDMSAQVIQPEVVKIQVKITGDNISTPIIIILNKGETTKVITDVPAGNLQIEFTGLDANGNVLSSRITNVTVTAGQTLPVSVILGVSILSDGFFPSTITLYKGDTLVFVNNDGLTHSFSVPGLFNSGDLPARGTFSYTFGNTSLKTYTCTREDGKILIIIIKDGDYATQPTAYPSREIFVNNLDNEGGDETGDGTISKPYETIGKGVEVANRDYTVGTINLRALENHKRDINASSLYAPYYDPNTSLTLRSNLTIRKYPYDQNECIVNFYKIDASTSGAGFILSGNNTVEGIEITGVMGGSGIKVSGNNCNINKCIIAGNGSAVPMGRSEKSSPYEQYINGGGINIASGSCNVTNCFIFENYAITEEPLQENKGDKKLLREDKVEKIYNDIPTTLPDYGYGGGIFVNTSALCNVTNSCIALNVALFGAGIANFGTCTVTGSIEECYINSIDDTDDFDSLANVQFPNLIGGNYALYGGGAIGNKGTCTLHTLILMNFAGPSNFYTKTAQIKAHESIPTGFNGGGGIINIGSCNITGSIIVNNEACSYGGGICNTAYPPQIGTCNISGNTLISDNIACTEDGGGIHNIGKCTITDCTITYNLAKNQGGGISNAYYEFDSGKVTGDCTISRTSIGADTIEYGNAAGYGGGIYNEAKCILTSGVKIMGNITDNDGGGIYNNQGGICNFGAAPGIIEGNHANYQGYTTGIGGGIYDCTHTILYPPTDKIFGNGNYRGVPPVIDNISYL
ncbi:MAG: hypothetical protein ABRQ38_14100 [Candidatus Eremiobacterota bacterium]